MVALARRLLAWPRTFAVLACCCIAAVAFATTEGPPPILNITTYRSPSGEWSATIDPSKREGGGPGAYRVEHKGKLAWEKNLDFTMWEAAITDNGELAGYGYTSGWRGWDGAPRDSGDMVIAIVGPDGTVRHRESRARRERAMHGPPSPTARGFFIDPIHDRFVVLLGVLNQNEIEAQWESFSLSTGKRLPDITHIEPPKPEGAKMLYLGVQSPTPVPGTPFTLFVWGVTQYQPSHEGVRLSLLDSQAKEVWHVDLPDEFSSFQRFDIWSIDDLKLVPPPESGRFSFRSPSAQARIEYSITEDKSQPTGWLVKETKREAEAVAIQLPDPPDPKLPSLELKSLGVVTLESGSAEASPPLSVREFDFDPDGRIGFVSVKDDKSVQLVLYRPDGTMDKAVPLPEFSGGSRVPSAVCVGPDRWVLLECPMGENLGDKPPCTARLLDAKSGTLAPIPDFTCPYTFTETIKGGDGVFAILGDYTSREVGIYDATGKVLVRQETPAFSPQDLAISTRKDVGILSGIDNQIVILSADSTPRSIDLTEAIGYKPNYVAGLERDTDGGWILFDFHGAQAIYRLDAAGKVVARFSPHHKDGRTFEIHGNVKRSPDGHLWTCDGSSLLRLKEDGEVDQTIGRSADSKALDEIHCAAFDAQGNIYAVNADNSSVHVFDSAGKAKRILVPNPQDFPANDSGPGEITVAGDGSVYYYVSSFNDNGYLKLNPDGTRAGFQHGISREVVDVWRFKPGAQERFVEGYHAAFLTDAEGKVTKKLDRRADRKWLDLVECGAIAFDGSSVVLAGASNRTSTSSTALTCFSPTGDVVKTIEYPYGSMGARVATNGKMAVIMGGRGGVMVDLQSGESKLWGPELGEDSYGLEPFFTADGKELWLLSTHDKKLFKFAMP